MKTLNWEQFSKCPRETIFCFMTKDHASAEGFYRKLDTIYDLSGKAVDFFFAELLPKEKYSIEKGYYQELDIDEVEQWGDLIDNEYIVFEDDDLHRLKGVINDSLSS